MTLDPFDRRVGRSLPSERDAPREEKPNATRRARQRSRKRGECFNSRSMTRTWRDSTSVALLRLTAGSSKCLVAVAHLVVAGRKMGGKVGLICGSCWSGKYSKYRFALLPPFPPPPGLFPVSFQLWRDSRGATYPFAIDHLRDDRSAWRAINIHQPTSGEYRGISLLTRLTEII